MCVPISPMPPPAWRRCALRAACRTRSWKRWRRKSRWWRRALRPVPLTLSRAGISGRPMSRTFLQMQSSRRRWDRIAPASPPMGGASSSGATTGLAISPISTRYWRRRRERLMLLHLCIPHLNRISLKHSRWQEQSDGRRCDNRRAIGSESAMGSPYRRLRDADCAGWLCLLAEYLGCTERLLGLADLLALLSHSPHFGMACVEQARTVAPHATLHLSAGPYTDDPAGCRLVPRSLDGNQRSSAIRVDGHGAGAHRHHIWVAGLSRADVPGVVPVVPGTHGRIPRAAAAALHHAFHHHISFADGHSLLCRRYDHRTRQRPLPGRRSVRGPSLPDRYHRV